MLEHPVNKRMCGAKNRKGELCGRAPVPGRERCKLHGGNSLVGVAVGTYKTGRYSKYLPQHLLDRYHEAAGDANLLALRDEIGVVDARLADLLKRVDTGESGARWKVLQAAWRAYQRSEGTPKEAVARTALA